MISFTDLPIRDNLRGKQPYGAPQKHVPVPLNVNENSHPIPQVVKDDIVAALARAVEEANRYPDREFVELRERLAAYLGGGLTAENMWAANGSNEVLQQILQAFAGPERRVLGFAPTYSMYPILTSGVGSEWVAAERDADFELSAATAVRQVEEHRPDVVILCTPNNPTGTPLDLKTVEAVYEATEGIVVVDEAYAEFTRGATSATTLLEGRERLIVTRTMSKAFAFAGVRLGYLAAHPAVLDALRLVRLPYHLSVLTQAAAIAAIDHAADMLAAVEQICLQRDRISARLAELGFAPYRSGSNFVLFGGVDDPQEMFEALLARGILIRDVGIPGHLRVTAGTQEETTAFLSAAEQYVQARRSSRATTPVG